MSVNVKNLRGTSDNTAPNGSWIKYWESQRPYNTNKKCRACDNQYTLGAHVIKVNSYDQRWYIVPLCSSCNQQTITFSVSENDLVFANTNRY